MNRKFSRNVLAAAAFGGMLALAACSSQDGASTAPAASAPTVNPRDAADLELYRKLLAKGSYELAAPIGAGVVARSPGGVAAQEIKKTLADAQAKAEAINEKRRLEALWLYQSGEQSGGTQNTASIYPDKPALAHDRIRLILRRHSDWGQSAYLYDTGNAGFVCKGRCKLPLKIDGKDAKPLVSYRPDTGEPAIFIDHDVAFVAMLEKAHTLDIDVEMKDHGAQTLHFEVGGFDPAQWPEPAKPSKPAKAAKGHRKSP
jgi:hypothetical protein